MLHSHATVQSTRLQWVCGQVQAVVIINGGWRRRRVQGNLRDCVEAAGLEWQGRAHSGLDDARNTARLAAALLAGGAKLAISGAFDSCELGGLRQRKLFPDRYKPAPAQHMATGGAMRCCAYIQPCLPMLKRSPGQRNAGLQGCQEAPNHGCGWQVERAVRVWHACTAVHSEATVRKPGPPILWVRDVVNHRR